MNDRYTAPNFHSCALITIDTQRDVLDGAPLEIAGDRRGSDGRTLRRPC